MTNIKIGIIGGGYMGKAHAVAFAAVGGLFDTALRPVLEMVCASTDTSAERYRASFGFNRATSDWRTLVNDPDVDAVVIASPQVTHKDIAIAAFNIAKRTGVKPQRLRMGQGHPRARLTFGGHVGVGKFIEMGHRLSLPEI